VMHSGASARAGRSTSDDVIQLAASLVDKSLVRRADNYVTPHRGWYSWRQFASTVSTSSCAWRGGCRAQRPSAMVPATCRVHSNWDRTDPGGRAVGTRAGQFSPALRWCIETDQATRGMRLSERMWLFWCICAAAGPRGAWLSELLALPAAQKPSSERAAAHAVAGQLAINQDDFAPPKHCSRRASDCGAGRRRTHPGTLPVLPRQRRPRSGRVLDSHEPVRTNPRRQSAA
jgi:hypothetical protein